MSKKFGSLKKAGWWILGVFVGSLVLSALMLWVALFFYEWSPSWVTIEKGEFGDSFGPVNALFSGLAFLGVIVAIILQGRELTLQREELKGQRSVMQKESFERTFFQLLEMIEEKYNSVMSYSPTSGRSKGAEVFDSIPQEWSKIGAEVIEMSEFKKRVASMAVKPYFLLLLKILRFVDEADFCEDEKEFYSDILRDQMKENELQALLVLVREPKWCAECPTIDGKALKGLIEKYALFFNIRYPVLKHFYEEHKFLFPDFYNRSAFGDRSDIDEFYQQN